MLLRSVPKIVDNQSMLSGKRFRLTVPTLGIETVGDERKAVQVPAGEIVTVLSGPRPDDRRMIDVLWTDKTLVMFAEDVEHRGRIISEASSA